MNLCLNAFVIQFPDGLLDTCSVTAPRALLLPYAHSGHCKDEDTYKECRSHWLIDGLGPMTSTESTHNLKYQKPHNGIHCDAAGELQNTQTAKREFARPKRSFDEAPDQNASWHKQEKLRQP